MNTIVGKIAGSSSVLRIDFDAVVGAVDDLIAPPADADYVAPGLIDLQVNGFGGVDFNDPEVTADDLLRSVHRLAETGVTRCFPTVITGSYQRMAGALRNLASAKDRWTAAALPEAPVFEAFHVEGPYISPEDGPRGAHPREQVRPPDTDEFDRLQEAARGGVRLVTVSPEWEETPRFVQHLVRSGVVASVGHTRANSQQIRAAVDAGATMSTHLGNGAHAILPKTQNYLWDQLAEDRLTASFIIDRIHIPEHFVQTALRAKGLERSVLITDAVMPALCEPGPYRLGEVDVELHNDGSVRVRGGTRLAGSTLRMDHAVGNAVAVAGISLREALVLATINPARAGRVAGRLRGLLPGEKADFVRFAWDASVHRLTVLETIVAGRTIFRSPGYPSGGN